MFQGFDKTPKVVLAVATSSTGTLMELQPNMWKQTATKKRKHTLLIHFNCIAGYPKELKPKYLEQLEKVYSKCILPSHYLPQLFTDVNCTDILATGLHVSEMVLPIENYTVFNESDVPQHCHSHCMYS